MFLVALSPSGPVVNVFGWLWVRPLGLRLIDEEDAAPGQGVKLQMSVVWVLNQVWLPLSFRQGSWSWVPRACTWLSTGVSSTHGEAVSLKVHSVQGRVVLTVAGRGG